MNFFILVFAMALTITNTKAQFQTASVSETVISSVGSSKPTVTSIGNDIIRVNGDVFKVTVINDLSTSDNPGIQWETFTGTYNGYTLLNYTSGILFVDAVLIYNEDNSCQNTRFDVIVAYSDASNSYLETFYWDYASNTFVSNSYWTIGGPASTAINIDANELGEFVITWDEASTGDCYALNGSYTSSCGDPSLVSGNAATICSGCESPDVAINYDGSTHRVYFCFIDNSVLKVEHDDFSDINGSYSATSDYASASPYPAHDFNIPRIACPNSWHGDVRDFMVVAEDRDIGTDELIFGVNRYQSGTPTECYYNDGGTCSPGDISVPGAAHFRPVVTYNSTSNQDIWIGWNLDNLSGAISTTYDALYPIVLALDYAGNTISHNYLDVPVFVTSADEIGPLAISGRYHTDNFYSFYNTWAYQGSATIDLYSKSVAQTSTSSLRLANSDSEPELNFLELLTKGMPGNEYNNQDYFLLNILDIAGKEIVNEQGNLSNLSERYSILKNQLSPGIYIASLTSTDKVVNIASKLFIGN
jgi:hypothetical protein